VEEHLEPDRPQITTERMRFIMLDTQVYKHTRRICNTYCFSNATVVARTRPNVRLYVHCLSCSVSYFPNP